MAWSDPMSKPQANFIRSLEARRDVAGIPQSEFVKMTKGEASDRIKFLKGVPPQPTDLLTPQPYSVDDDGAQDPLVSKGFYTVVRLDGEHRTFRVKQVKNGALTGRWIVSLLTGPDNESSYSGVGFANPDGFKLWNKFASNEEMAADLAVLAGLGVDGLDEAGLRYSLESGNCYICNRLLTDPVSIHRGIGPVCWGYVGGDDSVEEFEHTNPLMNAG